MGFQFFEHIPVTEFAEVGLPVYIDRWGFGEGLRRYPVVRSSRTGTGTGLGIVMHLEKELSDHPLS
jgi:hypothetical protein